MTALAERRAERPRARAARRGGRGRRRRWPTEFADGCRRARRRARCCRPPSSTRCRRSGLLAHHRAGGVRRGRASRRDRWPRCSGSSRPATPTSRRSRTATSSTSTRCATRARRPSRRSSSARCCAGKRFGNAQSEVGTKHVRDYRTTLRPRPRRPDGWRARRREGLQHRRAASPTGSRCWPTSASDGPMHVAWVERHRRRRHGRRRLGRHGPAHHGQRHGHARRRRGRPTSWITPYHLTFDGPADLRRVRPAAARRDRRRHRPGRARARRRRSSPPRAGPTPTRSRTVERHADDPLVVHAFGEMELAGARRRGAARRGRPGRRPRRRRPRPSETAARGQPRRRGGPGVDHAGRRSTSPAGSSRSPAPARRWPRSTSTGTGATPAPTPCTTRRLEGPAPRPLRRRRHPARPTTASSERAAALDRSTDDRTLKFHWFLPTNGGDGRHVVGGGHGVDAGAAGRPASVPYLGQVARGAEDSASRPR